MSNPLSLRLRLRLHAQNGSETKRLETPHKCICGQACILYCKLNIISMVYLWRNADKMTYLRDLSHFIQSFYQCFFIFVYNDIWPLTYNLTLSVVLNSFSMFWTRRFRICRNLPLSFTAADTKPAAFFRFLPTVPVRRIYDPHPVVQNPPPRYNVCINSFSGG